MWHVEQTLAVRGLPQSLLLAVQDIRSNKAVTVIGVATPLTSSRILARVLVRTALCQTLGVVLGQPAGSVKLVSQPGEAIAVESLQGCLQLSLSHAPGLSIAAIYRGAGVGVDLMRIEDGVEGDPDWVRVARDYLGPQVTASLQATTPAQCPGAFVRAWTRFEACLKCLGLPLVEWSPELGKQLASCNLLTLDFARDFSGLPAIEGNVVGAIAVNRSKSKFG